jgi:hypothetical protein
MASPLFLPLVAINEKLMVLDRSHAEKSAEIKDYDSKIDELKKKQEKLKWELQVIADERKQWHQAHQTLINSIAPPTPVPQGLVVPNPTASGSDDHDEDDDNSEYGGVKAEVVQDEVSNVEQGYYCSLT